MTIYALSNVKDNPAYEGFASPFPASKRRGTTLIELFAASYDSNKRPIQPELAKRWKPAAMSGTVHPLNDYPCIDGSIPAFSERAASGLRDVLSANGELLPFEHSGRNYYAYNVLCMPEVLDRSRTTARWRDDKQRTSASTIHRFEFDADRVRDLFIFRLYEQPYTICVTEAFKQRVFDLALNGFAFHKLWPLSADEDWWRLRNDQAASNMTLPPP